MAASRIHQSLFVLLAAALLLTACAAPSFSPPSSRPPSPSPSRSAAVAGVDPHQIAPAPLTPAFPPQPDAASHPLVPQLLTAYATYLDALNSFYRGQDAPLKAISTQDHYSLQVALRKSWNGDQAQEQLITPHVRVVMIAGGDATLADTSVYRTSWLRANALPIPPVVKPVRLIEHFHHDDTTSRWLFSDRIEVATDVELPDAVIRDDTNATP